MNKNFWDDFGRAVTGAADTVTKKAGKVADMARLKNQVYSLERENKKDFEAIGKIVYERFAAAGRLEDAALDPLCEEIARREILIGEYQGEIDGMKSEN